MQIKQLVSDEARAEFLNFSFYLYFLKAKFKNLAVFANTQKALVKPIIAMFYILVGISIYSKFSIDSLIFFTRNSNVILSNFLVFGLAISISSFAFKFSKNSFSGFKSR